MNDDGPYNPLTWPSLMAGLIARFEKQPTVGLSSIPGAREPVEPGMRELVESSLRELGVYALYYRGPFEAYRAISAKPKPIYAGKAAPKGGRTGYRVGAKNQPGAENSLIARLRAHKRSLGGARNLALEDFEARYLPVVPEWITFSERLLIEHYQPVWNDEDALPGFGNNPVGRTRTGQQRSWWDTLHSGRAGAARSAEGRTKDKALKRVLAFFQESDDAGTD